ncbi:MAG: hypothetical protein J6Y85_05395 [Alphaproteobacteria bacterium]|nr:hypothetical protein [Alphaproteobacteria bacterium]
MTPYLFWELLFLGVGVWVLALILVVYAWLLLRRQKRLIEFVLDKLADISVNTSHRFTLNDLRSTADKPEKTVAIAKDELISKYAGMPMSDSVNVSFVESSHEEND